MNYVSIEGDTTAVQSIGTVSGIMPGTQTTSRIDENRWTISFFCTDAAITGLQALGFAVQTYQTSGDLVAHLDTAQDDSDGTAIV